MYSVIASIKTISPVPYAAPAASTRPRFPTADFLKMLAAALACGLSMGLLAAAVAMLVAQVSA